MITSRKRSTSKSAGRSKAFTLRLALAVACLGAPGPLAFAETEEAEPIIVRAPRAGALDDSASDDGADREFASDARTETPKSPTSSRVTWDEFKYSTENRVKEDAVNGISYIISGSIAVLGGQLGQASTSDPLERGVYTMFQSIGIASIAFGIHKWRIGDEDRLIFETLKNAKMSERDRDMFLRSYFDRKRERERSERIVKIVAHGLIAAFNAYSASQQENSTVRNGLYFIGGVNLLAAASYTF